MENLRLTYEWILNATFPEKVAYMKTYSGEYARKVYENEQKFGVGSIQSKTGFVRIKKNIAKAIVKFSSKRQMSEGSKELFYKVLDSRTMDEFNECLNEVKLYFAQHMLEV